MTVQKPNLVFIGMVLHLTTNKCSRKSVWILVAGTFN